ncbi:MAG: PilZN3 domain-containing protein [Treponemataceae bacterium]
MDSRIVNAKAESYKDRSIRLTPVLFDRLGLVKKSIHLRVEEFSISCVPFDLSLTKASLLAFLSEREVDFFKKLPVKTNKFSVSWKSPYSTKPETFFIGCRIQTFRKPEGDSPYCFIDIEFMTAPLAFKELLVSYFVEVDEAERFYNEAPDAELSSEQIEKSFKCIHVSLMKEGCSAEHLKIIGLSSKSLRLFGELDGALPVQGEVLEFEPTEGDPSCLLKGECVQAAPSAEAPGFVSITVKLQFSAYAHSRIRSAVGWGAKGPKP